MGVPIELGSAYLEITTQGLDKATKDLGVLKSTLLDSTKGTDGITKGLDSIGKGMAGIKPVHLTVIADKVQIALATPITVPADPIKPEVEAVKPVEVPAKPIKPKVEGNPVAPSKPEVPTTGGFKVPSMDGI